ncbi:MAG: hypothetical protein ACI9GZ_000667 [Bacteroidia bacterium]|jgi:hypothetical protein
MINIKEAKTSKQLLPLAAIVILIVSMACRFNVREIGFAQISPNPYILYYFYDQSSSASEVDDFLSKTKRIFEFSNVKIKAVSKTDSDDPSLNYLSESSNRKFPVGVLLSPDGSSVEMKVPKGNKEESQFLRAIIASPFRSSIKSMLVNKYAVVLLIEGENQIFNQRAGKALNTDIAEIEKIMPRMPKQINEGPALVRLSREEAQRESSLLWSLGIDISEQKEPLAAIIYGRGRIMGDVITYEEILENYTFKLLNLIGADCECGLDRKWMLGKLIPMTWDPHLRTELFGLLKFDVENPMILAEMSQIISIEATKSGVNTEDLELFQPKEFSLSSDLSGSTIPDVDHASARKNDSQVDETDYDKNLMSSSLYAILGIVIVVALGAIITIVVKRR